MGGAKPSRCHSAGTGGGPEPLVNAAVCGAAADFLDLIPALPIDLGHLLLELLPG